MANKVFAFRGYFIAVHSQAVGGGQFIGHAAICIERPVEPAAAQALERVSSIGTYDSEERALQAAEFQAKSVIDGLKPNWAPFTSPGSVASTRH